MKSLIISNILLGAMLGLLTSCGGSKTSKTNFVVSQNFSIVNSSYDGGLSIYGKNLDTGVTFAYSSLPNGGQNQIVLDLEKGNWSFGVVGWSSGSPAGVTPGNLKGTPYCGAVTSVNLNSSEQTVNLLATQAGCLTNHFASSAVVDTSSTPVLKSVILNICAEISDGLIGSAPTYCNDKGLDESLGDDIWSIKLQLPSKALPGTTPTAPVQTACITANNLGNFDLGSANAYKIPTKNFPINIITYKDKNCQAPSNFFIFEQGLEATYGFDKKFILPTVATDVPKIFLPTTKSKAEGSALASLIPSISCSSGDCSFVTSIPTSTPTADYYIPGTSSSQIIVDPFNNCGAISSITADTSVTLGSCEDREDRAGSKIRVSFASNSVCTSAPCMLNIAYTSGATSTKYILSSGTSDTNQLWQQQLILETLGVNNASYNKPLVLSIGNLDSIKKSSGILSNIKEMMSSNIISGAFKTVTSCGDLSGSKDLDVFENGQMRRFRVSVTNISEATPRQLCSTAPSATGTCSDTLDKKIVLSSINGLQYLPQLVMKIDCNNRAGSSEEIHQGTESSGATRIEKKIVYWNVPSGTSNFRIQEYHYDQEMLGSSVQSVRTRFTQLSRTSSVTDPILVLSSDYEYSNDSGTPFERLTKNEIQIGDGGSGVVIGAHKQYSNSTPDSAGKMFILPEMSKLLATDSIHQYNLPSGTPDYSKSVTSPNGNYKLIVTFTAGTSFTYQIVSNSLYKKGTANLSSTYSLGDISINDAGKVVIAFADSSYAKFFAFDANSVPDPFPSPVSSGLPASASSKKIRVYIGNDNLITIANQSSAGIVSARIVDTAGALVSGNLSNGFDFESSYAIGDFIIHHTDGLHARLCYFSNPSIKCEMIEFPNYNTTGSMALISGPPSGTSDPIISITSGVSFTDSVVLYSDAGCSTSLTTITISTIPQTQNVFVPAGILTSFYAKINSGACTPLNISYFKSLDGRYVKNLFQSTIGSAGASYIDPKVSYNAVSGVSEFNLILDQNNFKKITVDNSSATSTVTSGATLSGNSYDNQFTKSSAITPMTANSSFVDVDQSDVPIKYPNFKGSSAGLAPQIFINNFTPMNAFGN